MVDAGKEAGSVAAVANVEQRGGKSPVTKALDKAKKHIVTTTSFLFLRARAVGNQVPAEAALHLVKAGADGVQAGVALAEGDPFHALSAGAKGMDELASAGLDVIHMRQTSTPAVSLGVPGPVAK